MTKVALDVSPYIADLGRFYFVCFCKILVINFPRFLRRYNIRCRPIGGMSQESTLRRSTTNVRTMFEPSGNLLPYGSLEKTL